MGLFFHTKRPVLPHLPLGVSSGNITQHLLDEKLGSPVRGCALWCTCACVRMRECVSVCLCVCARTHTDALSHAPRVHFAFSVRLVLSRARAPALSAPLSRACSLWGFTQICSRTHTTRETKETDRERDRDRAEGGRGGRRTERERERERERPGGETPR